jgi:hypothetical protein
MKEDRSGCAFCGAWGPTGEYHPYAYCMLIKQGLGPDQARANINAVLDHGRKLERLAVPNDSPIKAVRESNERGVSESRSLGLGEVERMLRRWLELEEDYDRATTTPAVQRAAIAIQKHRTAALSLLRDREGEKDNTSAAGAGSFDVEEAALAASNMEKAREVLADYQAGRPLQVTGDGWLVRFAVAIVKAEGR